MLTANVMHCLPEVMHKPRNNQPVVFYAWTLFNDRHCAITNMISVTLLLSPGLGLALSECKQWQS